MNAGQTYTGGRHLRVLQNSAAIGGSTPFFQQISHVRDSQYKGEISMKTEISIVPSPHRQRCEIFFSHHALGRASEYGIACQEIRAGLGSGVVDSRARLTCRVAALEGQRVIRWTPVVGSPLKIGMGTGYWREDRQSRRRQILLVKLPDGRRVHVVGVPLSNRLEIVTLWDPDDHSNDGLWPPHAQLPTARGARSLPPTRWVLGDPCDYRRPTFQLGSAA